MGGPRDMSHMEGPFSHCSHNCSRAQSYIGHVLHHELYIAHMRNCISVTVLTLYYTLLTLSYHYVISLWEDRPSDSLCHSVHEVGLKSYLVD